MVGRPSAERLVLSTRNCTMALVARPGAFGAQRSTSVSELRVVLLDAMGTRTLLELDSGSCCCTALSLTHRLDQRRECCLPEHKQHLNLETFLCNPPMPDLHIYNTLNYSTTKTNSTFCFRFHFLGGIIHVRGQSGNACNNNFVALFLRCNAGQGMQFGHPN